MIEHLNKICSILTVENYQAVKKRLTEKKTTIR